MSESAKMARVAYDALDEKLGEDIEILKIDEISVIADYLVIANGDNPNQIRAMLEQVEQRMTEAGFASKRVEGNAKSTWILMDYGDVIIHIFDRENRLFYDLERIWKDGKEIPAADSVMRMSTIRVWRCSQPY